jgi:hypothetical protein
MLVGFMGLSRDLLSFTVSSVSKSAIFTLESYFYFDRSKKNKLWVEPLTVDAAYLHAMIFTTTAYFDWILPQKPPNLSQRSSIQLLKALSLLRDKLSAINPGRLDDSTVAVILSLAAHAHIVGDGQAVRHHLSGLHKIINLRGGIDSFREHPKLLIEILR